MGFFSHLSLVRVGLLGVDASVGLDVLEGIVHQASVAAVVAVTARAVHQLLLAQGHQLAGLLEGLTLQGASLKKKKEAIRTSKFSAAGGFLYSHCQTHSTEGPAGAALLLILHRGDVSLVPPVDGGGQFISLRQPEESGALSGAGGIEATQAALRDQPLVLLVVLERARSSVGGFFKSQVETVTRTAAAKERRDPSLLTMSANSVMSMR